MNILITEVPNPNIRYVKFTGDVHITSHESFKSIEGINEFKIVKGNIRVEKTQKSSWNNIEKEIFHVINNIPGYENIPVVKIKRKTISESEIQQEFEEKYHQMNVELDEIIRFLK